MRLSKQVLCFINNASKASVCVALRCSHKVALRAGNASSAGIHFENDEADEPVTTQSGASSVMLATVVPSGRSSGSGVVLQAVMLA